jgi:hypothetical protein
LFKPRAIGGGEGDDKAIVMGETKLTKPVDGEMNALPLGIASLGLSRAFERLEHSGVL